MGRAISSDGDDGDDVHLWRLVGVDLSPGGEGGTEYACELCPETLVVPAGGVPPATI